ncbi:MAG: GNAT family N-acetyltransferase [Bacteroidota bacterium]
MKPAFHFETNKTPDTKELAVFLNEEYASGEIADERFLQWEYKDNPFGNAVVTLAKDRQHTLASQYAVIPLEVVVNGKILKGSLSLNTLTAEKFRGMGLFTGAAEENYSRCTKEEILFTIGVPNRNSFPGFKNKLRFANPGNLNFLIKPLHPIRMIKSFLIKNGEKKGEELRVIINESGMVKKSISFFNPVADAEIYESFWTGWKKKNSIAINRTVDYMSWRYFKNPMRNYEVFKLVEKEKMKAIISTRAMNIFGMRAIVVMDLLSEDVKYASELLQAISNVAKESNMDIVIAATANKKRAYSIFRKSGYWHVPEFLLPQQLPFIIRLHKNFEGSEVLFDLENWHFSFGDYDIF